MQNENDKIEQAKTILEKLFWIVPANFSCEPTEVMVGSRMYQDIITAMLEYAQLIASERCNELEERIKAKDEQLRIATDSLNQLYKCSYCGYENSDIIDKALNSINPT